ncbi:TonB-dependent receptor domain-containing protein [Kangiella sediminilitoris]|uniref:TonB-denpendent receptor n=1 Tax=Kangiella sediminilitoris TaxID=1144748 RepID=A0A1B3B9E0_9GAMM|nr:TonB-dependent receptor [Kangiella sediminilitoris]AOE49412.1 TonB-denpendent receptor [Kangiella sediminilitoris]
MDKNLFFPPVKKLLVTTAVLATLGASNTTIAAEEETGAEAERILVTGSRIRQAQAEGANPVRVLDREYLDQSGLKTVGDILARLPAAGSALNTRFNSSGNFGFPPDGGGVGAGAAQVSLRHMKAKRTLVLVDGIRWVNGSSASGVSNSVDLNTIPISMIERIEILEDGASSIYGSDAIAGVVNVITRKDFDGMEFNAYGGMFDEGDGETGQFDLAFGASGDKHRVFFSLSHYEQDPVDSIERELSALPKPNTGLTRGSSGTPQGRFLFLGQDNDGDGDPDVNNLTINDGVTGIPTYDPNNPGGATDDFHTFTNNDRYNYAEYNLYVTPSQRTSIFGQADYQLTDNVNFYTKALFNNRKSTNRAAPEPMFLGPEAGTGGLADTVSIHETNPYNPFGMTLDENNLIFIGRRPIEGGPRIFKQNVDTTYVGMGLNGDFIAGDSSFYWDLNYTHGKNEAKQTTYGSYNIRHIKNALGPLSDCQAIDGCVPLNIFGGQGDGSGTITQEMLDYIQPVLTDQSENVIDTISANITGDLFEMPAGFVSFAAGIESREYRGYYQPDAIIVAGDSNGVPSTPTRGSYEVDEYYAEFKVPLLADMSAAKDLSLTLAARNSDYSTFGSDTTTKFGLLWRVTDNFMLRGSLSEGFRAPSIGELYSSGSRFDAELADRCSDYVGTQYETNCAALGVPDTYQQLNSQISITTGGNPDLKPETSDSTTFGFVFSPELNVDWVNTLDIKGTYYKHELEGAIEPIDAQAQLDLCVNTLDPQFCNGISRTSGGAINGFNNRLVNIGAIDTSGYDIEISYTSPQYDWGMLNASWVNTFVNEYVEESLGQRVDLAGIERNDSGIPEWKSRLAMGWKFENLAFNWTVRHVDSLTESCSDFLDGTPDSLTNLGLCSNPNTANNSLSTNKLDASTYSDFQFSYFPELEDVDMELTVGINNAFNEAPPACYSCSLNGYDPSVYDPEGSFSYVSVKMKF